LLVSSSPIDWARLERAIIPLARNAGAFIQWAREQLHRSHIHEKERNQLVTLADVEVENFLVEGLRALLPNSRFLAEETHHTQLSDTPTWIIDPIDGTTNYIQRLPFYCISIALMVNQQIVLGIIHDPIHNETFHASEAHDKAFLNGQPIQVSHTSSMEESVITTGFPFSDFSLIDTYTAILKELMQQTRALRRPGSAALDLAYTACGRMDGFYEYGLSPWDVAAGAYLVLKAGGKVSDFHGTHNYLFGREIVAGPPTIHGELLRTIQHHLTTHR